MKHQLKAFLLFLIVVTSTLFADSLNSPLKNPSMGVIGTQRTATPIVISIGGSGLGVGQTWQNVSASRSLGVNYTNTTGNPIMVAVACAGTSTGVRTYYYINGVQRAFTQEAAMAINPFSFVVPAGNTYSISAASTVCYSWSELR